MKLPRLIATGPAGGLLWQVTEGGPNDPSVMAVYEQADGYRFDPIPLQTHLTMSPYWEEVADLNKVVAIWRPHRCAWDTVR